MFGNAWKYYGGSSSLTVGSTGSGKTYAAAWDVLKAAVRRDLSLFVFDPHYGSLARTCFQYLVGHVDHSRILFDSFSDFERVLPYHVMQSGKGRNEFERLSINDLKIQHIIDSLSRRRDIANLIQNPQTEEMTQHAIRLLIEQKRPRPDADLLYAFWPDHSRFDDLLHNCTHALTRSFFSSVASGATKPGTYASAKRLISSVYGNALFQARCGSLSKFNVGRCIDERKIVLIEGGGPGVSNTAANSLLSLILLQVLNYIRTRPKPFPKAAIWIDEASNANMIGSAGFETRAINELRKYGLDGIHILVQSPDFANSDIERSVLQNCRIHHWFQCGSDSVAGKGAADLGNSALRTELQQLQVGQRYTKNKYGVVKFENVPLLPDPYGWPGMMELKAEKVLARIRQRSEYVEPTCDFGNDQKNEISQLMADDPRKTGRKPGIISSVIRRFWPWGNKIRLLHDRSVPSSPVDRLQRRDELEN